MPDNMTVVKWESYGKEVRAHVSCDLYLHVHKVDDGMYHRYLKNSSGTIVKSQIGVPADSDEEAKNNAVMWCMGVSDEVIKEYIDVKNSCFQLLLNFMEEEVNKRGIKRPI